MALRRYHAARESEARPEQGQYIAWDGRVREFRALPASSSGGGAIYWASLWRGLPLGKGISTCLSDSVGGVYWLSVPEKPSPPRRLVFTQPRRAAGGISTTPSEAGRRT